MKGEKRKRSGGLDLVSFYADRERALNSIHGNYDRAFSIARNEDTLDSIQGSAADAHTLADLEEGIGFPVHSFFHNGSDRVNLFVWNGRTLSWSADKIEDAVGTKYLQAIFIGGHNLYEYITTEQRQFDRFLAIAPAANFSDQRQEC